MNILLYFPEFLNWISVPVKIKTTQLQGVINLFMVLMLLF